MQWTCQLVVKIGTPPEGELVLQGGATLFQGGVLHPYTWYLVLADDGLNSCNFHAPTSDQNLSSLFLNEFVDCASIRCCGNEFQVPTMTDSDTED